MIIKIKLKDIIALHGVEEMCICHTRLAHLFLGDVKNLLSPIAGYDSFFFYHVYLHWLTLPVKVNINSLILLFYHNSCWQVPQKRPLKYWSTHNRDWYMLTYCLCYENLECSYSKNF